MRVPNRTIYRLFSTAPLCVFALTACGSDAISQGTCNDSETALFDQCVAAGCSPELSQSARGLDTCEREGSLLNASGSGACAFEGAGSCYVICDCASPEDAENNANADRDGDGIPASDDCDDENSGLGDRANDADCDGVLTPDDCNDGNPDVGSRALDNDCDGFERGHDCDDNDESIPATDMDCDGVRTAADCDDDDPTVGDRARDADCDGFETDNDCDDSDPTVGSLPTEASPFVAGATQMVMVCAHTFEQGCTPSQTECVESMTVTLTRDYWIATTEVSQGEFSRLMGANPAYNTSCGADCPVENVTWSMAAAYTNALSREGGLPECYSCSGEGSEVECLTLTNPYECAGYRLPTESEWEAAARCGADPTYAADGELTDYAWYDRNSGGETHPVATRAATACGLHDMSGNVSEWVNDEYDPYFYRSGPQTDPSGVHSWGSNSYRGGNALLDALYLQVSIRMHETIPNRYRGFRVGRTAP